jgi:hypothetical protein
MPDQEPIVISVPPPEANAPIVEPEAPVGQPPMPASDGVEEEEIDLVAEMIAQESIVSEERMDELMEGMEACRSRLEELSTLKTSLEAIAAENPMLTQIQRQLAEVQTQLAELKASMGSPPLIRTPPDENETTRPNESTEPENPPTPPAPPKRRRFARL